MQYTTEGMVITLGMLGVVVVKKGRKKGRAHAGKDGKRNNNGEKENMNQWTKLKEE